MATKTATIARPATGETLRGKQKEKDVRMSNIIAAKGASLTCSCSSLLMQALFPAVWCRKEGSLEDNSN